MESQLYDSSMPLSDRPSSSGRPLPDRPLSSPSTYGEPMPLSLHQNFFLSHSGVDKNFVGFLYKESCRRYSSNTIAFFDIESLPKATPISMVNILEEARSSKLGVLVLTEDFFMKTPNPMLELEAFVAKKVRLLPLFFGMSVDEFKEESRRAKWEEQWRKWSAEQLGGSSVEETIEKWRAALDIVKTFSGLEYGKEAKTNPEYVDRIVKEVTRIIPLLIPLTGKGVCGKDRLCQIVDDLYKECASKRLSVDRTTQALSTYANCRMVDVVGIYGFAGIGKTSLCRCLHDFYFGEFNGKVCYVDLGWLPYDQGSFSKHSYGPFCVRMQHMLSTLTDYANDCRYPLVDVNQVKELLRERLLVLTYPIFLAIDINSLHPDLDQSEAREEAEFYLSCEFPEGSKIFITSRSRNILKNLTYQHDRFSAVIQYMPPLLFEEARDILLEGMPNLRYIGISNLEDDVNECVKMCTFKSDSLCTTHYHPLMLKCLAASVNRDQDWKESLRTLQSEGVVYTSDALKKVFKLLDFTFANLSKEEQKLFLDFALFYNFRKVGDNVYVWIERLYSHMPKKNLHRIFVRLKELCFIEEFWRPPSLVVEFCRYKATQGEYAQYYEVVEGNTCWRNVIPRSVRYISISGCGDSPDRAWAALDLRAVEAVEVLQLVGIKHAAEVLLSSTTCAHLRSLIVRVLPGTAVHFIMDENWPSSGHAPIQRCHAHQALPLTLFWLELEGNVCFKSLQRSERIFSWLASYAVFQALRHLVLAVAPVSVMDLSSSVLGALWNLEVVSLSELPSVQSIDVTTCSNLKKLSLRKLPYLRSIDGLDNLTSFERLEIRSCKQLPMLTVSTNSSHLIRDCTSLKRISLCTKSSYPGADSSTRQGFSLEISRCPSLRKVHGLSQYTGYFFAYYGGPLDDTFGDLLEAAAIDSSICKAKVERLELKGDLATFAGLRLLEVHHAQYPGLLLSALTKAHPKLLKYLNISCKEGGDCGCDKDAPQFGPFPSLGCGLDLHYHCPQVRDLGSSLSHLEWLGSLDLTGCTSVEVWPDFASMTYLREVVLNYTSLKEWPTSLLRLRYLRWLSMRGCKQLPAEELMKGITALHEIHLTSGHIACINCSLQSLLKDLKAGERDRCSVVDAVDSCYQELVTLFHRSSRSASSDALHMAEVGVILEILYRVWFGEGEAAHASLPDVIRTKFSRVLFSEKTLSIPFFEWRERFCPLSDRASGRIYRRLHSREFEYVHTGMARCLMGVALVGGESIGWYEAAVNDDLLKDIIIPFLKWFIHEPNTYRIGNPTIYFLVDVFDTILELNLLRERVGEALCKMARVPMVAAALGADFVQRLEARAHVYNPFFSLNSDRV